MRSKTSWAVPETPYFRGAQYDPGTDPHGHRAYHAPIAPGSGWCSDDLAPPAPAGGTPTSPANTPSMQDETHERPVRIRYIDIEQRFA